MSHRAAMIPSGIVHRYLARQLIVPTLACIAILGFPVIVVSLFSHLPGPALGSRLVWSAIYGIVPTAFYLTLPIAAGFGSTWGYAQLNADGIFTVLYAMRVSVLALSAPVLALALPVVTAGYVISCVIAPHSVSHIQDVMFTIRNNLSTDLFRPQVFYSLIDGRYTIFFDRNLGPDRVGGVFFSEQSRPNETQSIVAREAHFETRDGERHVIFTDGTLQTVSGNGQDIRTIVFTELVRPFGDGHGATIPRRNWRGLFEFNTWEFVTANTDMAADPVKRRAWISEAIKRFGIPLLGLGHPLAGLALVLVWGRKTGRRVRHPMVFCLPIMALHLGVLFGAEGITYYGAWLAWLVSLSIAAELAVPLAILLYLQRRALG